MVTRHLRTEDDRTEAVRFIKSRKLPLRLEVRAGARRSIDQNALSHAWYAEIARQLEDRTPQDVRAWCKLHIGVPLLRAENEQFKALYDKIIKPLDYADKLAAMTEPFDLPVTRIFRKDTMTAYLDAVERHFSEQGVRLMRDAYLKEGE